MRPVTGVTVTLLLCALALAVCVKGARQEAAADQRSPPRYGHEYGSHHAGDLGSCMCTCTDDSSSTTASLVG